MDLTGVPTPSMDCNSTTMLESLKKFCSHSKLIFSGPLKEKDEDMKIMYLLLWMGKKGQEIYKTLTLTEEQRKSVNGTCNAFEQHVQPKSNPVLPDLNSVMKFRVTPQ